MYNVKLSVKSLKLSVKSLNNGRKQIPRRMGCVKMALNCEYIIIRTD